MEYFMKYDTMYCRDEDRSEIDSSSGSVKFIHGMVAPVQCWMHLPSHISCNRRCSMFNERNVCGNDYVDLYCANDVTIKLTPQTA